MPNGGSLWVYAAPVEGDGLRQVLGEAVQLRRIGTGKAAAAMGLTRVLSETPSRQVVAFGLCGAYPAEHGPGASALAVGDLCVVGQDVLADEGVRDERGFRDLAALGLGDCGPFEADAALTRRLAAVLEGVPVVRGATVSTCSGTDELSLALGRRTGAQVETMEGAVIGLVCRHFGARWTQLRCVSNRTGNRSASGWDLRGSIARLHDAVRRLAAEDP